MKKSTLSKLKVIVFGLLTGVGILQAQPNCTLQVSYTAPTSSSSCNGFAYVSSSASMCGVPNYMWSNGATTPSIGNLCPGTYDVVAMTSASSANCCSVAIGMVTIPPATVTPCNINANFSYSSGANGLITFNNTSTGTNGGTTYLWNFGDATSSTAMSPSHTYANGTYNVSLFANNNTNPFCGDSLMQVITISNSGTCIASAGFSLSPSGTPLYWNAFPTVPNNVTSASWSWGDGSSSNTLYTSHSYSAAGSYDICLSVTVSCGAYATYCSTQLINKSSEDLSIVHVNVINPNNPAGLANHGQENSVFTVYPNPSNGLFNLKGVNNGPVNISIYNLVGKLVFVSENTGLGGSLTKDIDLEGISNGVYFIKINSGQKSSTTKIVIENQK